MTKQLNDLAARYERTLRFSKELPETTATEFAMV